MIENEAQAFERRWNAWQRRGEAHEKVARQRLMTALPILAALAGAALWYLR
jgi:hypothetical protein